MVASGILKAAATATTNPDPNGLTTTDPYDSTTNDYSDRYTAAPEWTTQAATYSNAIIHRGCKDGRGQVSIDLAFSPSGGSAITYTIKVWFYVDAEDKWVNPASNGSIDCTGYTATKIEAPGYAPVFLEVDSISSGSVDIYFNNGTAVKL